MRQVAEAKMWTRKADDILPKRIANNVFLFQTRHTVQQSTLKNKNEAKEWEWKIESKWEPIWGSAGLNKLAITD